MALPKSDTTGKVNSQLFIPPQDNLTGGAGGGEAVDDGQTTQHADDASSQQDGERQTAGGNQTEGTETTPPVSFDAFKGILSRGASIEDDDGENELSQQAVDKKRKEVEAAAKKDKEEKKDDEQVETQQQQQTEQQTQQQQQTKPTRDLTGLPENIAPLFKKMSNDAFDTIKPIVLEHGKLKQDLITKEKQIEDLKKGVVTLPDSYYDHPQGFVLDPEYIQAETNVNFADQVLRHWNTQLALIRQGKPWTDLHEDPKTGAVSKLQPKEATVEDEAAVLGYINYAQQQLFKQQHILEQTTTKFKTKHEEDLKLIQEGINTYFPGFEKPDHPTAAIQKQIIEALPKSMQKHPVARLLAMTAAANAMLRAEILQLQKQPGSGKTGNGTVTATTTNQGPKKSQVNGGGGGGKTQSEVKFSDFRKVLDR